MHHWRCHQIEKLEICGIKVGRSRIQVLGFPLVGRQIIIQDGKKSCLKIDRAG